MVSNQVKRIAGATLIASGLAFANVSNAAISDDGLSNGTTPHVGTGGGELFLSVLDPAGKRSLTYDLGITVSSFRANPLSYAGTLFNNSALTGFISATADQADLRWNLAGVSNMPVVVDPIDVDDFGFIQSGANVNSGNVAPGYFSMLEALTNASLYLLGQNGAGNTDYAANDINYYDVVTDPGYYMGSGLWGAAFGGKTASAEMFFGQTTNLYFVTLDPADPMVFSRAETLAGQWRLTAAGLQMLPAAPVPVPAGVWLMGSALAGLAGMLRKVRERAAQATA